MLITECKSLISHFTFAKNTAFQSLSALKCFTNLKTWPHWLCTHISMTLYDSTEYYNHCPSDPLLSASLLGPKATEHSGVSLRYLEDVVYWWLFFLKWINISKHYFYNIVCINTFTYEKIDFGHSILNYVIVWFSTCTYNRCLENQKYTQKLCMNFTSVSKQQNQVLNSLFDGEIISKVNALDDFRNVVRLPNKHPEPMHSVLMQSLLLTIDLSKHTELFLQNFFSTNLRSHLLAGRFWAAVYQYVAEVTKKANLGNKAKH